jgi:cytochrome c-type biogenesis protein CcmH/NrfG
MESMGKKPRRRRSFTAEFKAEIVELCQQGDRSVGQVAKDFDLTETAVREWVKQAQRDAGTRLPDDPAGYECLGHVCVIRGDYEDGLLAFLRALRSEPPEPWRLEVKVGQTYQDLGETGRALAFLRAAYEHAPGEPMTVVALAQILRVGAEDSTDDPRFQEAFALLTAGVEHHPYSADLLVSLAQSHVALGNVQETLALLRRAVDADPDHPFASPVFSSGSGRRAAGLT